MLPKPCLVVGCVQYCTGRGSRCYTHASDKGGGSAEEGGTSRTHTRLSAEGDGAAARSRRQLKKVGAGTCAHCGAGFLANELHVDHIKPLAYGGTDYDHNLQLLCIADHKRKSAEEARLYRSSSALLLHPPSRKP